MKISDHDKRVEEIRIKSFLYEIDECEHHIAPCGCDIGALQKSVEDLLAAYDDMKNQRNSIIKAMESLDRNASEMLSAAYIMVEPDR